MGGPASGGAEGPNQQQPHQHQHAVMILRTSRRVDLFGEHTHILQITVLEQKVTTI